MYCMEAFCKPLSNNRYLSNLISISWSWATSTNCWSRERRIWFSTFTISHLMLAFARILGNVFEGAVAAQIHTGIIKTSWFYKVGEKEGINHHLPRKILNIILFYARVVELPHSFEHSFDELWIVPAACLVDLSLLITQQDN